MAGGKPGVMIYFETGRAIKKLDYEAKGRLLEAILEYAESKTEPSFDTSTQNGFALDAIWPLICDKIDRDSERYEDKREKNRINGLVSNFKRNYAPLHGIDPEDKIALAEYIRQNTVVVNDSEQPLTIVNNGERIQPTATTSPSAPVTGTAPTNTSESTIKGIRDNVEKENGLTLTSQPVDSDTDERMLSFADMKKQAIEMLSRRM